MKLFALALLGCFVVTGVAVAEEHHPVTAIKKEIIRYGRDFKCMTLAPIHWDRTAWTHFGEGVAAVAVVYAADRPLMDAVQANRSHFSDQFSQVITPFGARRAENISALMIVIGAWTGDDRMRDAGRDSLESEVWAGGVVTPLLKRSFGRARPIQEEGAESFHPLSSSYASFPSGHATNAFAFATAIASHYDSWVVPTIVYSIASGVAISRVNDRAHFVSDVLAGALIGRAVAKGVVHRQHGAPMSWTVTPSWSNGTTSVMIHIRG
ncbi:MAG: hypothetical protein QOI24_3513 [Acidobacteriota bacterium]|jgi:membrane-associated phospholipid phosphatase|nr:hypothetical protein [Acidobacteriota bacterium]